MSDERRRDGRGTALAWMPLLAGAINSYGPVAMNYGFALYFLPYRHGFVKRGLVGEMFSRLTWMPRGELIAIEYAFLAAAFALSYVVFRELLFGTVAERRLTAALLCAPAMLPHLGFLFAQPDVTLYILTLGGVAALLWMRPLAGAAASCLLCCIALLAHEAFSLMFYPLIAAILLQLCMRRRLSWAAGLAHVAIVALVFIAVLHFGTLEVSPDLILREAQIRTNVGVQRQVYDVMASNLSEQRGLLHQMYGAYVWRVLGVTFVFSLPYFVLLGRLLFGTLRAAGAQLWQRIATGLLFLAPLTLCWFGHDVSRWLGAMGIDTTLFILWMYLDERRESVDGMLAQNGTNNVRIFLTKWVAGPNYTAWLIYLLVIGPFGATGIRSAEQLVQAWWGP